MFCCTKCSFKCCNTPQTGPNGHKILPCCPTFSSLWDLFIWGETVWPNTLYITIFASACKMLMLMKMPKSDYFYCLYIFVLLMSYVEKIQFEFAHNMTKTFLMEKNEVNITYAQKMYLLLGAISYIVYVPRWLFIVDILDPTGLHFNIHGCNFVSRSAKFFSW